MNNEAAERLREWLDDGLSTVGGDSRPWEWLDEALAAAYAEGMDDGRLVESAACRVKVSDERRVTVERIRERLDLGVGGRVSQPYIRVLAILDEEAAR